MGALWNSALRNFYGGLHRAGIFNWGVLNLSWDVVSLGSGHYLLSISLSFHLQKGQYRPNIRTIFGIISFNIKQLVWRPHSANQHYSTGQKKRLILG